MATMTCPMCAETIPAGGGWCPFCRSDVALTDRRMLPVDNTFAWAIVAVPIVVLLLAVILVSVAPSVPGQVLGLVMVAANTWFAVQDRKRVCAAGYEGTSPFWGFLLMPVYLIARGRQTGNWAVPLAYGFLLLVYLAVAAS